MIPRECKRPVEVDCPVAVVPKHAVREGSSQHTHPTPSYSVCEVLRTEPSRRKE